MKFSNIKVEQITETFEVVEDYGEILTKNEMRDILLESFPGTEYKNGCVYGYSSGKEYCIYFKNVSYLGTPHPFFKKRIQIGDNFKDVCSENAEKGIQTLLMGVYKYKGVILFVDFDITRYVTKKSHNSSAHVYTLDLKNGLLLGIFQKEDFNKNIITVFTKGSIDKYLTSKIDGAGDLRQAFVVVLDDFYANLHKRWFGIPCYQEMLEAGFNNALQPEWPGFYHEFKLDQYI